MGLAAFNRMRREQAEAAAREAEKADKPAEKPKADRPARKGKD